MSLKLFTGLIFLTLFTSCTRLTEHLNNLAYFEVTPKSLELENSKNDTAHIVVNSNASWSVRVDASLSQYISVEPVQGSGNATITVTTLNDNTDSTGRIGFITIEATGVPSMATAVTVLQQGKIASFARNVFGGSKEDAFIRALPLPDGDFLIAGHTNSTNRDITDKTTEGRDIWISRLTISGTFKWQKTITLEGSEEVVDLMKTEDGNYLIVYNRSMGFAHQPEFLKFDASGNIHWQKRINGSFAIESIKNDRFGGYTMLASIKDTFGGFVVPFEDLRSGNAWLIRITENGEFMWRSPIAGSGYERGDMVSQSPDGTYVACGISESTDYDFDGKPIENQIWVARFDTSGRRLSLTFHEGGFNTHYPPRIVATADNGFVLTSDMQEGTNTRVNVSKYNGSGELQWKRKLNTVIHFMMPYDLIVDSDNLYQLLLSGYDLEGEVTDNDGQEGWVLTLNSSGDIVRKKRFGTQGIEILHKITEVTRGVFVMTGTTTSNGRDAIGYFPRTGEQDRDSWIVIYE